MEELLPIVIAVAVMIYRVYTNFVKEQEKARKRNPGRRPDEMLPADTPVADTQPAQQEPIPEVVQEPRPSGNPYEPAYKEVKHPRPVREIYQEVKYEPMIPETVVRHKYKEEPAQEVKLGRTIHAPHKHGAPIVEEEVVLERSAYADFDMHDAVIKSAILNRPEY